MAEARSCAIFKAELAAQAASLERAIEVAARAPGNGAFAMGLRFLVGAGVVCAAAITNTRR